MTCEHCGKSYDADVPTCPYCRMSPASDGLTWTAGGDSLARSITESLLARCDADAEALLARDIGSSLALDELRGAVERVDRSEPIVSELEDALRREATVALDGIALSELIDPGGGDMKMIRRGLVFLKNRKWVEALEWWALQRARATSHDRRGLLLLLLEAFTHRLAGDHTSAATVCAHIASHALYRARGAERR